MPEIPRPGTSAGYACPGQAAAAAPGMELVHAADPEMSQTIKRSTQPYFVLQGNVCALFAAKDHNLFLYDGGIVPDPTGSSPARHDNKTARTISP